MKKYFILILFLSLSITSFSQVFVDGFNLNEKTDIVYIDVFFERKKPNYVCHIRYGQKVNYSKRTSYVKDEKGQTIFYASRVKWMNYLYQQGWTLVTAYSDGSSRYIFKRKEG